MSKTNSKVNIKKISVTAIFAAVAYITLLPFMSFKVAGFLSLEIKDAIIAIPTLMFGPVYGIVSSLVLSFAELITISGTGWYGFIMNFISSAAFTGIVGTVYMYRRTLGGAIIGFTLSSIITTAVMLIANYFITPLYTGAPTSAVVDMMLPILLPFNLVKALLNSGISIVLYKPLTDAFRRLGLIEKSTFKLTAKTAIITAAAIIVCLISLYILIFVL